MTDRTRQAVAVVVGIAAIAVVLLALSGPALGYAVGVNELPVTEMTADDDLEDPEAEAWGEVESKTVVLSSAESGLPGYEDTAVGLADVETAHTDERIHIRLTWDDATADEEIDDPQAFVDGVAVQLPFEQDKEPPIEMGSEEQPVNVWYWSGDGEVEELYAGGMGSTTEMDESAVSTQAVHDDGEWSVVFTRDLTTDDRERTEIATDQRLNVAFAVFDGDNAERGGIKAASEWYHYPMDPEPGPSVLELVLWTVGGLAIVAVLVMTVYGIRNVKQ
ncbi:ethylbenzene dehydrogenase-related protein [Halalkaliarchaeum sp. AArc-GB]|uniref:ethylbenzene dehydrogenase-related protein n=1 Tax=Halalkaliarchaeum sp. AArc-GB TaxID=3074078 RepID=UPI0028542B96|nr:ethylbenzene dehydrogenase-related protein [Halalkaliarchaeum sp. AArc-GB]MDR5674088.1 ethylbenzene dehydrogenase-related protein [Halalkaliarchaeum sp. AArc-GB]